MPKVSVISIALVEDQLRPLRERLETQTFRDFEFVGEVGGTIPEAWNRAIQRARGEILVFIETDAIPVNERWLEDLVGNIPDERTIVKGLEVTGSTWDMANLAAYRRVFEKIKFDQNFQWSEDTELSSLVHPTLTDAHIEHTCDVVEHVMLRAVRTPSSVAAVAQ